MGEFLGLAAGSGMLLLIGLLMGRFLMDMGWMRRETGRMMLRITGMTLGVGAALWLFGALIHVTLLGGLSDAAAIRQVFCGPVTQEMFEIVKRPASTGPAAFLFVLIGHALGALLFGQYELAAVTAAFLLTDAAACLVCARLSGWWREKDAERAVFLLLCLPGGVFLFLPGAAPMILLLAALAFFLGGRWLGPKNAASAPVPFLSSPAYDLLLCLCAVFSALATACAVLGRIG